MREKVKRSFFSRRREYCFYIITQIKQISKKLPNNYLISATTLFLQALFLTAHQILTVLPNRP